MQLPPVEVSQSPEAKFREYLASRPKPQRCTKQQERMVRFIFSQHNHFDAERLIEDMKQAGLPVSRATVYRTLTKLVDAGLLRRLELGPSMFYEHDYGYPHHEHLYCQHCGKVIEFQNPALDAIIRDVQFKHLDVVPATPDLAGAEVELVDRHGRERMMRNAIATVAEEYDYDPAAARQLLADAGYGPDNPARVTFEIGPSFVPEQADINEAIVQMMPRSALENVDIDHVLPMSEMAALLPALIREEAPKAPARTALLEVESVLQLNGSTGGTLKVGDPSALACPDCGAPMKLRPGRRGFFLGCSKYPKCRGTKEAPPELLEAAQTS